MACLAALGGLALVGPSLADAEWSPYVNIAKQQGAALPNVAMDPAGDAVFSWQRDEGGGVYTRARDADGTRGPVQMIAPPGPRVTNRGLAVDPHGNAYFLWQAFDGHRWYARARVRYADGTLGPRQTIAASSPDGGYTAPVAVGVGASGSAVFTWVSDSGGGPERIRTRTRSPSGKLSPVLSVAQGDLPGMGVDSSGNATLVWGATVKPGVGAVFSRVLDSDGTLGPVTRISRAGYSGYDGVVAVNPDGRAVFEWLEETGGMLTLLARSRSATGDLRPPLVLDRFSADQAPLINEAIGAGGDAAFCWRDTALLGRTLASDGSLGPMRTVADTDLIHGCVSGVDSQGNVVFAAQLANGPKDLVFARSESPDGTLGPMEFLSPYGFNAYFTRLAMTPAGDAVVAWQAGRKGFAIQAAFGQ